MTARQKYSQAVRNYNRALKRKNWRRVSYWNRQIEKQGATVEARLKGIWHLQFPKATKPKNRKIA